MPAFQKREKCMTDPIAKPIAGPEDAEPGALLEARRLLLKRLDEPGQDSASTLALLAEVQYWLLRNLCFG